jgi:TP901 family phage tail tape measure protein
MTRIGASQVFFNIVAQFNAEKLIKDREAINTVMKAVSIDTAEAIMKPMEDASKAIGMMVNETTLLAQELGFASIEFEKFFGSSADVDTMRDSVVELGMSFAMTGEEALAAGSRASQVANLIGRANVGVLTELAFTLAEISDLNAEEAQRGIIQLHQQTGMLFGELDQAAFKRLSLQEQQNVLVREGAEALDALNTIANRSVALEGDLVRVMGTFAAQGELVGDSFEFMAAQSAVLLEAGEEQGTAGRALRMMYARLGGDISGARTEIEALGYEFTKGDGINKQMKTMQEIMEELKSKGWDQLNPAQKQNIAQTIAGNRHYVRFIKLMENYDRALQLSADGAAGFDSALGQANKALEHQSNLLKKATNEQELLKAEIGEGLMPITTAYVQKQNQMLEVTKNLTKGTGPLGRSLGRLAANMQVLGGAVKLGLGIRTLGVGFEMFTSIQKQLHGILVANEHLHSKQANHLAFNVKASKYQTDILKGQQHIQQKINAAIENRRVVQYAMAPLIREQEPILERLVELEKQRVEHEDTLAEKATIYNMAVERRLSQQDHGANSAQHRVMMAKQEVQLQSHLVDLAKDLYMNKSSFKDDALVRQFLTDSEMVKNMTESEKKLLVERNMELKKTHTLLQRIKGENELIGALGGRDTLSGINQKSIRLERIGDTVGDMLETDRIQLAKILEQMGQYNVKQLSMKYKGISEADVRAYAVDYKEKGSLAVHLNKQFENDPIGRRSEGDIISTATAFDTLAASIKNTEKPLTVTRFEYDALMQALTRYGGKIAQTEDILNIMGEAERQELTNQFHLEDAVRAQNEARRALNGTLREELKLEVRSVELQKELAPMLAKVNDTTLEQEERYRQLGIMIDALTKKVEKKDKAMVNEYMQKSQLKFSEDTVKSIEKMQFSLVSLTTVVSGMAPQQYMAVFSMAGLASSMTKSAGAAGTAIKAFVALQVAEAKATVTTQVNTGAVQANNAAQATRLLTLGKITKGIGMALLPMAALGGALLAVNYHQQKQSELMREANQNMLEYESTIDRLGNSTKVIADEELAKALGAGSLETKEMLENTELIDDELKIMTDNMHKYTDAQQTTITQGMSYLHILKAISGESKTLNDMAFADAKMRARKQLEGVSGALAMFSFDLVPFQDDMESMEELFDSFDRAGVEAYKSKYGNPVDTMRQNLNNLFQVMESGVALTEDQIILFDKAFDNDALTAMIREMNSLVATDERLNFAQGKVNNTMDGTSASAASTASEIENLTAEIYNFNGARDELFFGGQYGNVTGSLYKQVVQQGVGTLYHKNEVIMTTNFHGFFNEQEAADRITRIVTDVLASQ